MMKELGAFSGGRSSCAASKGGETVGESYRIRCDSLPAIWLLIAFPDLRQDDQGHDVNRSQMSFQSKVLSPGARTEILEFRMPLFSSGENINPA